MSLSLQTIQRTAMANVAVLLIGSLQAVDTHAAQCTPKTPCPCAADGTCHPQGPWGHSQTRWRPWPGDDIGTSPTKLEEEEIKEKGTLEPWETPPPEKEGQRGPNTPENRRKKSADQPTGQPAVELPLDLEGKFAPADLPAVPPAILPDDPLPDDAMEGVPAIPPAEAPADKGLQLPKGDDFGQPEQDAPMPEADPADDFDPFGSLDRAPRSPQKAVRRTTQVPHVPSSGPPELPSSLKKLTYRARALKSGSPRQGQDAQQREPVLAMSR